MVYAMLNGTVHCELLDLVDTRIDLIGWGKYFIVIYIVHLIVVVPRLRPPPLGETPPRVLSFTAADRWRKARKIASFGFKISLCGPQAPCFGKRAVKGGASIYVLSESTSPSGGANCGRNLGEEIEGVGTVALLGNAKRDAGALSVGGV